MQAGGFSLDLGAGSAVVPRAVDFDGDARLDIIAGSLGRVLLFRNTGTPTSPVFAAQLIQASFGQKDERSKR